MLMMSPLPEPRSLASSLRSLHRWQLTVWATEAIVKGAHSLFSPVVIATFVPAPGSRSMAQPPLLHLKGSSIQHSLHQLRCRAGLSMPHPGQRLH